MSPYGEPFLSFLLSRIGLTTSVPVLPLSDAVHCNRSRSALQPLPQCTASVLAVHCIRPCSALPLSAELKNMGEGIPLKIRYSLTLIT